MRVLGIDGATSTGWALVERQPGSREVVAETGRLRFKDRSAAEVVAAVEQLAAHKPDLCAFEGVYVGDNARTALTLAVLAGRFRQETERRGLETEVVMPGTWQLAILRGFIGIASNRAQRKQAAITWAKTAFGQELDSDRADALGLAVFTLRTRLLAQAQKPLDLPPPAKPARPSGPSPMLNQGALRRRGWSPAMVARFLPVADELAANPHGYRSPMPLFARARVEAVEATPDFIEAKAAADQRRRGKTVAA